MRRLVLILVMAAFVFSGNAWAQWGAGVYGGMQACPYDYGGAEGSVDDDDGIQNIKRMKSQKQKSYDRKKKRQDDLRRRMKGYERAIRKTLLSQAASSVLEHLGDRERGPNSYATECNPGNISATGTAGLSRADQMRTSRGIGRNIGGSATYPPASVFCVPVEHDVNGDGKIGNCSPGQTEGCDPVEYSNWWPDYAQDGGAVDPEVCNSPFIKSSASTEHKLDCKAAIQDYYETAEEFSELAVELAEMKEDLREFDRTLDRERERLQSKHYDSLEDENSEAWCPWCESRRRGYARSPTMWE
ncbi:MAG: hypothetical protein KDD43_05800, partial [Bdellovibrionales bacterium]|nr:hypothetical protein [Bdellovibrionales bacterium]